MTYEQGTARDASRDIPICGWCSGTGHTADSHMLHLREQLMEAFGTDDVARGFDKLQAEISDLNAQNADLRSRDLEHELGAKALISSLRDAYGALWANHHHGCLCPPPECLLDSPLAVKLLDAPDPEHRALTIGEARAMFASIDNVRAINETP